MGMHPAIGYMVEALTYLGMKANGISVEERIRKAHMSCAFSEDMNYFISATRLVYSKLEAAVHPDEESLKTLFGFFAGMPDGHPIGYNIASMLCVSRAFTTESYEEQKAAVRAYSRRDIANAVLTSFGLYNNKTDDGFEFFDRIEKLPISKDDKLRILTICAHREEYLDRVFSLLDVTVAALRSFEPEIQPYLDEYCARYSVENILHKLNADSGFVLPDNAPVDVIPYLLNPGIISVMDSEGKSYCVHIGMLFLARYAAEPRLTENETLETLKSLSDSSRIGILRCLSGGELYGQEIAKQLGLYSTTISHHMAKLINCRLVRCRLAGNKAFYSIDTDGAKAFINSLADLLSTKPD